MKPEARLRSRCRAYLTAALPAPGRFTAIEHGRKHTGTKAQRGAEWARLAAQGVKQGLPDMEIHYLGKFIGVELKAGKNGLSENQIKMGRSIVDNGGVYWLIRSVVQLHDCLVDYGLPVSPSFRAAAMGYDAILAAPEKKKKSSEPRKERKDVSAKAKAFQLLQYGVKS